MSDDIGIPVRTLYSRNRVLYIPIDELMMPSVVETVIAKWNESEQQKRTFIKALFYMRKSEEDDSCEWMVDDKAIKILSNISKDTLLNHIRENNSFIILR